MELYLIRHGQTEWNQEGRMQGRLDSPLTPLGREQAVLLGQRLQQETWDAVYCSPTGRAFTTARLILSGREDLIVTDERLREIDMGPWEGRTFYQVERDHPVEFQDFIHRPDLFRFPGAEDYQSLLQRAGSYIEDIQTRHAGQRVLTVTHGGTLLAILTYVEKTPLAALWERGLVPPASLTSLELDGRGWVLHSLGDISHYQEVLSDEEE